MASPGEAPRHESPGYRPAPRADEAVSLLREIVAELRGLRSDLARGRVSPDDGATPDEERAFEERCQQLADEGKPVRNVIEMRRRILAELRATPAVLHVRLNEADARARKAVEGDPSFRRERAERVQRDRLEEQRRDLEAKAASYGSGNVPVSIATSLERVREKLSRLEPAGTR